MKDKDSRKFLNPKKLNSSYWKEGKKGKFWGDGRKTVKAWVLQVKTWRDISQLSGETAFGAASFTSELFNDFHRSVHLC